MVNDKLISFEEHLPLVELPYNRVILSPLGMTLSKVVYDFNPPSL